MAQQRPGKVSLNGIGLVQKRPVNREVTRFVAHAEAEALREGPAAPDPVYKHMRGARRAR